MFVFSEIVVFGMWSMRLSSIHFYMTEGFAYYDGNSDSK